MKRPRPSYKALYYGLLESMTATDQAPIVVRDDLVATHRIESNFGTHYSYDVHFEGSSEELDRLDFDGEDTERIKIIRVSRELSAGPQSVSEVPA